MSKRTSPHTSIKAVPRVIGMMRVQNEARWIVESITSILPLCAQVLVLDDHSMDDTIKLVQALPKTQVIPSPFTGWDESRDKNFLLGLALMKFPDWVLCIDGDEVLEENGAEYLQENLSRMESTDFQGIEFPIAYCWGTKNTIRTDGHFGTFHRVSMFRPEVDHGFRTTVHSGNRNLHCGNAPNSLRSYFMHEPKIKHYGYMLLEDRQRKIDLGTAYPNPTDTVSTVLAPWKPSLFPGINHFNLLKKGGA